MPAFTCCANFLVISLAKNDLLVIFFFCCLLVLFCAVGLGCQGAGCKGQFVSWVLLEFGKAVKVLAFRALRRRLPLLP